jgi:putative ATP-binding cassette transporter
LPAQFANREPRRLADKPTAAPLALRNIESRGASYTFATVTDVAPFKLCPVDLSINRGETLFIVGEDGCGKTRPIKLLLGLYSAGALRLNGEPVEAAQMDAYRQMFSAIFADYHLFDDLTVDDADMVAVRASKWRRPGNECIDRDLSVDHKTSY